MHNKGYSTRQRELMMFRRQKEKDTLGTVGHIDKETGLEYCAYHIAMAEQTLLSLDCMDYKN